MKLSNPVIEEKVAKAMYHCVICNKQIREIYGVWGEVGGTCSRACESIKESQPREFGEPNV